MLAYEPRAPIHTHSCRTFFCHARTHGDASGAFCCPVQPQPVLTGFLRIRRFIGWYLHSCYWQSVAKYCDVYGCKTLSRHPSGQHSRIYCAWIKVIAQKLFLSSVRCFGGFQIKTVRDLSSDGEVYLFISTDQRFINPPLHIDFSAFWSIHPFSHLLGLGSGAKRLHLPSHLSKVF